MNHYAHSRDRTSDDGHLVLFEHILNGVPAPQREEFVKRRFPRVYATLALGSLFTHPHARLSSGRTLGAMPDE